MVCTSAGKLIIQVLENHGKVILEVSFCFPQWKRNSGRGAPISSCWDFFPSQWLPCLSHLITNSVQQGPVDYTPSTSQVLTLPALPLPLLQTKYNKKKKKKNGWVGCTALRGSPQHNSGGQLPAPGKVCLCVPDHITFWATFLQKAAVCKGHYKSQQYFVDRAKANVHLRL